MLKRRRNGDRCVYFCFCDHIDYNLCAFQKSESFVIGGAVPRTSGPTIFRKRVILHWEISKWLVKQVFICIVVRNTTIVYSFCPDMHKFVVENRQKYGRIWRVWMFNFVGFMISDPKVLEVVMSSSTLYMAKSRMYGLMRSWLGDGLLLSSGKKWHKRRKIITPAFHFSILEQFAEIFDQQSRIMASRLWKVCDGRTVDIHPFVSQMALDVVCETAMGVQINAQTEADNKYVKAVVELVDASRTNVASEINIYRFFSLE